MPNSLSKDLAHSYPSHSIDQKKNYISERKVKEEGNISWFNQLQMENIRKKCIYIDHVQVFFLSLFLKQHRIATLTKQFRL
jgi:hypothetical protein